MLVLLLTTEPFDFGEAAEKRREPNPLSDPQDHHSPTHELMPPWGFTVSVIERRCCNGQQSVSERPHNDGESERVYPRSTANAMAARKVDGLRRH